MYCPKCGKPVGDILAYCPECSASLAWPGQASPGTGTPVAPMAEERSRPQAARAGLLMGAVLAALLSALFLWGSAEDPIRDSGTATGLCALTVLFLLLFWCVGYLSRASGLGYGFGVGFCCLSALGSLAGVAIAGAQDNHVGIVMWLVEIAVFTALAFTFRGFLAWGRVKRAGDVHVGPSGPDRCPRCGAVAEQGWTTCRGCALPLTGPGLTTIGPDSFADGAASSEGLGKAVPRGFTKALLWLTGGR